MFWRDGDHNLVLPRPMATLDAAFLATEADRRPANIGAVALLRSPPNGDDTDIKAAFAAAVTRNQVAELFRRRPRRSPASLGQWYWHTDTAADLDYHVKTHTLPPQSGSPQLWELVSRLHSGTLDRERPLWQLHLIDGLVDGRLAIYVKAHHALCDGVSALRLLQRGFSTDPSRRVMPTLWEPASHVPVDEPVDDRAGAINLLAGIGRVAGMVTGAATQVVGVAPVLADTVWRALRGRAGALNLAAPETPLNAAISGERSITGCIFPLARLRHVAKPTGATINDVVLAMCAGALRRYLQAHDALPEAPLVAMVPVSLRADEPTEAAEVVGGNQIVALMCPLATDVSNPAERLARIHADMVEGKAAVCGRSQLQNQAASALGAVPLLLTMATGRTLGPLRPANVMISTIGGIKKQPLYWNGARLDALYPLSVPVDGQPLNITTTSIGSQIMFGLTGCAHSHPDVKVLAGFLAHELDLLDKVYPLFPKPAQKRRRSTSGGIMPAARTPQRRRK